MYSTCYLPTEAFKPSCICDFLFRDFTYSRNYFQFVTNLQFLVKLFLHLKVIKITVYHWKLLKNYR